MYNNYRRELSFIFDQGNFEYQLLNLGLNIQILD